MKQLALSVNGTPISAPGGIPTGGFGDKGISVIQVALTLLFILADVMALAFIIYAGIQWAMSGGDKQKIQASRNRLIYSIIGLIVITISFSIVKFITDRIF